MFLIPHCFSGFYYDNDDVLIFIQGRRWLWFSFFATQEKIIRTHASFWDDLISRHKQNDIDASIIFSLVEELSLHVKYTSGKIYKIAVDEANYDFNLINSLE